MGQVQTPQKVMLFAGLLYNDHVDPPVIYNQLENEFGTIVLRSKPFLFTETDYYAGEMGTVLTREWVAFDRLIDQEGISSIKLCCNAAELEHFSEQGRRNVNIDPGYLCLGKVVLATTKDNQHRLYLRDGIYGEVTLRFCKGTYVPWKWTYRDYRREEAVHFFQQLRSLYRGRIHA